MDRMNGQMRFGSAQRANPSAFDRLSAAKQWVEPVESGLSAVESGLSAVESGLSAVETHFSSPFQGVLLLICHKINMICKLTFNFVRIILFVMNDVCKA